MVNSYMCMKRYCELKGIPVPWTHHDWNEAIRYAHLDPEEDWPKRKSAEISPASKGVTSAEKTRAKKIDSQALSPTRGRLKVRLDHETRTHMPTVCLVKEPTCQLHRWAHKEFNPLEKMKGANNKPSGSRSHVMRCNTCGVNLCLHCWEIFHSKPRLTIHVPDILAKKN